MNTCVLSTDAALDLEEIWSYIAADSIDAADGWIEKLFVAFDLIGRSPSVGHRREDLTNLPVLFWPVGSYLVIYRVSQERVEIVAVTRGSRDIPVFLQSRSLD